MNESSARGMIHQKLAEIRPRETGRNQEVDVQGSPRRRSRRPDLGIGELLNKRYPFAEEDAKRK